MPAEDRLYFTGLDKTAADCNLPVPPSDELDVAVWAVAGHVAGAEKPAGALASDGSTYELLGGQGGRLR